MHTDARSREALIEAIQQGANPDYLFFYGHAEQGSEITKACLSQWYPSSFTIDGKVFKSAEHYMMWGKAVLFGDAEIAEKILASDHPGEAKKLGRQARGFVKEQWDAACMDIVTTGNVEKFGQDERLKAFLLATGDKVLVEAAPRDRIWGIGMGGKNPAALDPKTWRGRNLLGFCLMEARARLKAQP